MDNSFNVERMNNMLEILEFIFQDIWHFLGTIILLETIFGGLRGMFNKAIIRKDA